MEKKIEYLASYKFWLTFFATLLGILASQFLPSLLEGSITNLSEEFFIAFTTTHFIEFYHGIKLSIDMYVVLDGRKG